MRVNYTLKVLITPIVLVKKYFAWTYHKVDFVYDNLFSELARLFGTGRCGFVMFLHKLPPIDRKLSLIWIWATLAIQADILSNPFPSLFKILARRAVIFSA